MLAGAKIIGELSRLGRILPIFRRNFFSTERIFSRQNVVRQVIYLGREHIFSAHAQVPTETDISQRHKFVCIIVRVDIETGIITDCHVPMYTPIQNDFVKEIVIGKSLYSEKEVIMKEIDDLMHTPSKRALVSAIQGVYNNFVMTKKTIVAGPKRMNVQTGT